MREKDVGMFVLVIKISCLSLMAIYILHNNPIIVISISLPCLIDVQRSRINILIKSF